MMRLLGGGPGGGSPPRLGKLVIVIRYIIDDVSWVLRLLKPQRLVSIGMGEKEKRVLAGWRLLDWVLRLVAVEDEKLLHPEVQDQTAARENPRKLVIFMSDNLPCCIQVESTKVFN